MSAYELEYIRALGFDARHADGSKPAPIAIGDTFVRVGETDAWEITASTFADVWTLRRGAEVMATRAETLLDPAQWVRVERL